MSYLVKWSSDLNWIFRRSETNDLNIRETHPLYIHESLGDPILKRIRLIELLANDNTVSEMPQIRIMTCSFLDEGMPLYEALSYCWGDATHLQPILCNGNSILWVTQNLFDALQRIRPENGSRILWADAICISQEDLLEKSWQVRMMADIYLGAERVLAWLGRSSDKSDVLETCIPQLLEAKEAYDSAPADIEVPGSTYYKRKLVELAGERASSRISSGDMSTALEALTQRDWWSRVWIIQEFLLAKEVILCCGKWQMPWDHFESAYDFAISAGIEPNSTGLSTHFLFLRLHRSENNWREKRLDLGGFLTFITAAQASNPRDYIYAVLSLASDGHEIDIDYKKPVEQVYEEAMRHCMLKCSDASRMPSYLEFFDPGKTAYPSWVPDLRIPIPVIPLTFFGPANATGDSKHRIEFHGRKMWLEGFELDQISEVGVCAPPSPHKPVNQAILRFRRLMACGHWSAIFRAMGSDRIYAPTGEKIIEVFWQTIMGQCDGRTPDDLRDSFKRFELELKIIRWVLLITLPFTWSPSLLALPLYATLMIPENLKILIQGRGYFDDLALLRCYGRRMFETSQGYIGLAPAKAREGDRVCLIKGQHRPFILRRAAGANEYYIIGESYMHGVMNGEIWNAEKCHDIWIV